MRVVLKTVAFQILCVLLFGLIYVSYKSHFIRDPAYTTNNKKQPELLDCLFLATTVQAGVGYSDLYPITDVAKIIMIIQQFIMISTNVFLLYIFTV
jgi:uncharacterized membrane protein